MVVGALFFGVGTLEWRRIRGLDEQFQRQARTVQGTVVTKITVSSTSGGILRNKFASPSHHVTYRFTTPEGKAFEGSASVYADTWDALVQGGPIRIMYLADEPTTSRIEGRTALGSALAQVIMGGLLALGGGALLFWDMRRLLSKRRSPVFF